MNEYKYINESDALDILDQLEDAIENGERGFYSQARKMICDLHGEKIIHCKDCKHYCNVLYEDTQFEYGECSKSPFSRIFSDSTNPYNFCSWGRLKE